MMQDWANGVQLQNASEFVVFGHGQDGVEDDMDDELPALQEHLLEKG